MPLVALLAGITWPLSFGGFTSLIPVIVPDKLLAQANALEATSFNVAIIAGPALAGTICAVASPEASLFTEAALTLGVIGLIARIRRDGRPPPRATTAPAGDSPRGAHAHGPDTRPARRVGARPRSPSAASAC